MTSKVRSYPEIEEEFDAYVGHIVHATMVTVDSKNRPRTRVLIPVWENAEGTPLGWLATYRTPIKSAHIARNPHVNFSYVAQSSYNSVAIDATAKWIDNPAHGTHDPKTRERIWQMYARTSPRGAGYHLGQFWNSPDDPKLHIMRLEPWRIQVIRGLDLRSRIWQAPDNETTESAPAG